MRKADDDRRDLKKWREKVNNRGGRFSLWSNKKSKDVYLKIERYGFRLETRLFYPNTHQRPSVSQLKIHSSCRRGNVLFVA